MRWVSVLLSSVLAQGLLLSIVSAIEFRQLTDSPATDRHPSWTPDGQYIVFESNRNGTFDLYRVPAAGGSAEQLTNGPQDERFPEVSPDGTQIAFSWLSTLNGQIVGNIYVVPSSGTGEWTRVSTSTHFMDFDWHPAWSRDGSTIYFSRRKGTDFQDWEIMKAPAVGGATTVFEDIVGVLENRPIPSWDGTKVAFESNEGGLALNIYETILAQPGSKRQLTFENVNTGAMGYSPDGQTMVYSSRRETGWFDLYLLNLQDLSFTRLTDDAETSAYDPNNSDAVYSPDGTKITLTSRRNTGNDNIWVIDLTPVVVVKEVGVDVLPERCPNKLPDRFRGILKVAIPGSAEFDPSLIDPTSIRLQGSNIPERWNMVNVTAPASGVCECPGQHDAYDDLLLEFSHWNPPSSTLVDGLEEVTLEITGNLQDGTPIHGSDCLSLSRAPSGPPLRGTVILSVDRIPGGSSVTYSVGEPGRVEITTFDVSGRRLTTLVDQEQPAGQFRAFWQSPQLSSGIYFYKLVAGEHEDVRKFIVRH